MASTACWLKVKIGRSLWACAHARTYEYGALTIYPYSHGAPLAFKQRVGQAATTGPRCVDLVLANAGLKGRSSETKNVATDRKTFKM